MTPRQVRVASPSRARAPAAPSAEQEPGKEKHGRVPMSRDAQQRGHRARAEPLRQDCPGGAEGAELDDGRHDHTSGSGKDDQRCRECLGARDVRIWVHICGNDTACGFDFACP